MVPRNSVIPSNLTLKRGWVLLFSGTTHGYGRKNCIRKRKRLLLSRRLSTTPKHTIALRTETVKSDQRPHGPADTMENVRGENRIDYWVVAQLQSSVGRKYIIRPKSSTRRAENDLSIYLQIDRLVPHLQL